MQPQSQQRAVAGTERTLSQEPGQRLIIWPLPVTARQRAGPHSHICGLNRHSRRWQVSSCQAEHRLQQPTQPGIYSCRQALQPCGDDQAAQLAGAAAVSASSPATQQYAFLTRLMRARGCTIDATPWQPASCGVLARIAETTALLTASWLHPWSSGSQGCDGHGLKYGARSCTDS